MALSQNSSKHLGPEPKPIRTDSIFIEDKSSNGRLHLRRFWCELAGPPVLMLHGAIENGKIFYSNSGKGLAPFLAAQGFDVYVADLGGRGLSTPRIARGSNHGQWESITREVTLFSDQIRAIRGDIPQHWLAHSWGGVLFLAHLARYPERLKQVRSLVFFGTKRSIQVWNRERVWKIDFGWNRLFTAMTSLWGYLPARELGFGSDNETLLSHRESVQWVKAGPWRDPRDGFDYEASLRLLKLPPLLVISGAQDHCLGHIDDIQRLIQEAGSPQHDLWRVDYGHIDMLTHPRAPEDHFPKVAEWMKKTGD